jgi:tRNA/tmRNA/rRNA uracil-C5-methylase (TrmA/RlmC/RlmD family)
VWDLYCGAGALGLHGWLAGGVDAVCGVETSLTSVCVARRVSGALGAPARFEVGTAALAFSGDWPAPGAVVVNPPRKGLDTDVLRGLVALRAPRIVYMSCDPATFARDALVLCGSGYQIGELEAWDLLPLTRHAEVLARFDLTAGRAAR